MKCASGRNRFLALTTIESEDDEQSNADETVQEVVEITVDSGAAESVWPSRKNGAERTKSKKAVNLVAANGSPIRVEGDARLKFIRGRMKCSMKFLDADVKRPLASVSAIVDERTVVVFGQHELFIENGSTGQRIPMCRKNGVFVMRLDAQRTSVFRRRDEQRGKILERCELQGENGKLRGEDGWSERRRRSREDRRTRDARRAGGIRVWKGSAKARSSPAEFAGVGEMTHFPFRSWCRHCIMGRR